MKKPELIRKLFEYLFGNHGEDPIDQQKNIVSDIQKLVGIYNVFGDNKRRFTIFDLLATVIFAGAHMYVGSLSQLVYLVQVFPDKVECFKVLNCISATSVPFSKHVFMWTARSRLRTIFSLAREGLSSIPPNTRASSVMLSTLYKARYASWVVVLNQGLAHVMYLFVPFLFTIFGNHRYLPTTPGDSYGLSPKYQTPFYEATFAMTAIATFFSAVNQTGYIVLFVTLLSHELGHCYSITETLNEIQKILTKSTKEEDYVKTIEDKLKFCIKQHQFLLKFHDKIRQLYTGIFGAHFFMMTVVLVTTLQTVGQWDIRNTILTGFTGILPLYIYCFGGELLISAGSDMSATVYACGWEQMEVKHARMVQLMLCMSQKPMYLMAADAFIMNRETFGDVARVVYKIYAVFN